MKITKLHEEFVKELQKKIPQKSELISKISEILHIEKESASRRLYEKVQFSVHEMGILAKEFKISLDSLVYKDINCQWLPLIFESPMGVESMDVLYDIIDTIIDEMHKISRNPIIEYGSIFNSYPIEFYIYHPHLMKFMFFKWGYYFVGTEEFNDYTQWETPDRLANLREKMDDILANSNHAMYIWDETLIWTLVNEIDFFYKMGILNEQDLEDLRKDMEDSLNNLEKYISGTYTPERASKNISFYVSNMNLGVSSFYMITEKDQLYNFKTNFTFLSSIDSINGNCYQVKDWIDSFKKISVLISGSGPLDRKRFFIKQKKIIDIFLTTKN